MLENTNLLVSIITPCYNGELTLKRAIQSVLKQDFLDWEMIIISDDDKNYREIVENYGIFDQRLQFTSTGKIGSVPSNARNVGIKIAKGKDITNLDCDDAFKPQKLSSLIPLVEKYGAAISQIEYRDSDSDILLKIDSDIFLEHLGRRYSDSALLPREIPLVCRNTNVCMYDRTKIKLYYDLDLSLMEDFIFLMSFFNTIDLIGYHSEPLYIYNKREGSICNSTNTPNTFINNKKKILEKLANNQTSIKSESAKIAVQNHLGFSMYIEELYEKEIKTNPTTSFMDVYKRNFDKYYSHNFH